MFSHPDPFNCISSPSPLNPLRLELLIPVSALAGLSWYVDNLFVKMSQKMVGGYV